MLNQTLFFDGPTGIYEARKIAAHGYSTRNKLKFIGHLKQNFFACNSCWSCYSKRLMMYIYCVDLFSRSSKNFIMTTPLKKSNVCNLGMIREFVNNYIYVIILENEL